MKIKMISLSLLLASSFNLTWAEGISEYEIPFGNKLPVRNIDGTITVNLEDKAFKKVVVTKEFYGVDNKGFSNLPRTQDVSPLNLSKVKFGGNLQSSYNWELNSYYDLYTDLFAYAPTPLDTRLRNVQERFQAEPIVQVNMMGWHPQRNNDGTLSYVRTADAKHAARKIEFLNKDKNLGIKNIAIDNEPFLWESTHGKDSPSADQYIEMFIDYVLSVKDAQSLINGRPNDLKIWGPEMATGWTDWQTNHTDDCVINYALKNPALCSYGENKDFTHFIPYFLYKLSEFENDPLKNPAGYKLLDYLTIHYYPLFRNDFSDQNSIITKYSDNQNIKGMLESVNLWDSPNYINRFDKASPLGGSPNLLQRFQAWIDTYYPQTSLAITEFGIDSVENINYHPIVRPLYLADLVPRLAQFGVQSFIHSFLQGGEGDSSWALINGQNKSPLYYMYSLYSNKFKGDVVVSTKTYGDEVNSYTVISESVVKLFLVNKNTKVHNAAIKFNRLKNNAQEIAEVSLPAWSLTVLEIPTDKSGMIKVYNYGAKEMGL